MDIVTHGMMGIVLASPLLAQQPLLAGGLALGSALPDADVLSRIFGKRAFLRAHQTYSHSLPVIGALSLAAAGVSACLGLGLGPFMLGLCLGMILHSLLDVSNTYGITLFAPFSRRRISLEWVFFIDGVVLVSTTIAFVAVAIPIAADRAVPAWIAPLYAALMLLYFGAKACLRRRAQLHAPPGTLSLLPSAAIPWLYLGCARVDQEVILFRINALSGVQEEEERLTLLDEHWSKLVDSLPEVCVMRELTPAYHVVSAEEIPSTEGGATRLVLRDLRTRNFKTRFGMLEVLVARDGSLISKSFHV